MSSKGESGGGNDPTSIAKTWELNIYELNRIPHEIIYDETEIAVSPKVLQSELMCPICLDILKTTMTTKECLHRFCHDCIIHALRAGNKECPTCRKKLISKRSLRPDPNFDGIIAKIYPNREEYDAIHEKVLEKLNKKHLTAINSLNNSSHGKQGRGNRPNSAKNNPARAANNNNTNNNQNNAGSTSTATTASTTNNSTNGNQINTVNISSNNENNEQPLQQQPAQPSTDTNNNNSNQKSDTTSVIVNGNRGSKRALQTHSDDSGKSSNLSFNKIT